MCLRCETWIGRKGGEKGEEMGKGIVSYSTECKNSTHSCLHLHSEFYYPNLIK